MRFLTGFLGLVTVSLVATPTPTLAETYEEYLARLRDVCAVECMKPRDLQRVARRLGSDDEREMAVMMDVKAVDMTGDVYELHDRSFETNPLVELALLGSAGINTSGRTGIGGLPRDRSNGRHPESVVIEIDRQVLFDLLNPVIPGTQDPDVREEARASGESIVVEGNPGEEFIQPTLARLRTYFQDRRIVVRGKPKLQVVFYGGRRDFRRKQVSLVVDNVDDIVLLPRYNDDGEAVLDDPLEGIRIEARTAQE